jgi:arabinan endo-1,5-alpha-L-arabinosidase
MKKITDLFVAIMVLIPFAVSGQPQGMMVHDPVGILADSTYHIFATGMGIDHWTSKDLHIWKRQPAVFAQAPEWAVKSIPTFKGHIWAPDVVKYRDEFLVYYSVSAFAKNTSSIGLVSTTDLKTNNWTDHGAIITSVPSRDQWNAIDPNFILDNDGTPWLSFGSFWGGIQLVKLAPDAKHIAQPEEWASIARRPRSFTADSKDPGDGAIEAPFIINRNGYFYLFASIDYCCRGKNSSYKVIIGRSRDIRGPYLDKDGKSLYMGGGTVILEGDGKKWAAAGHNGIINAKQKDYFVCHAYDLEANGAPKLIVKELSWDDNFWPILGVEIKQ